MGASLNKGSNRNKRLMAACYQLKKVILRGGFKYTRIEDWNIMKGLRHHTQMAAHVCLQMSTKITQTVMQRSGVLWFQCIYADSWIRIRSLKFLEVLANNKFFFKSILFFLDISDVRLWQTDQHDVLILVWIVLISLLFSLANNLYLICSYRTGQQDSSCYREVHSAPWDYLTGCM